MHLDTQEMKLQGNISKTWCHLVKKFAVFDTKRTQYLKECTDLLGKNIFILSILGAALITPYHWQYLKTQPTIIGNDENQYSRANAMNYLRGNKRSKIIHHFSSFAWFSLCKFCQQNENSEYMRIIQNAVACVLKVVGKHDILINQDEKKSKNGRQYTIYFSTHYTLLHNKGL